MGNQSLEQHLWRRDRDPDTDLLRLNGMLSPIVLARRQDRLSPATFVRLTSSSTHHRRAHDPANCKPLDYYALPSLTSTRPGFESRRTTASSGCYRYSPRLLRRHADGARRNRGMTTTVQLCRSVRSRHHPRVRNKTKFRDIRRTSPGRPQKPIIVSRREGRTAMIVCGEGAEAIAPGARFRRSWSTSRRGPPSRPG
jgi:hypothetical protein